MALNAKQRAFVAAYSGNATEAARAAGYSEKTARVQGSQLLTNPDIVAAIREREAKRDNKRVATREDRQAFWTETMRDQGAELNARLKASELLGKSEADFTDNLKHSGAVRCSFSIGLTPKRAES